MQRDLRRLSDGTFDLCVVGGGIYGACVAREAALRGLRVALIEKADFGHATSANTLRIIHGGLRHLSRGELPQVREGIREQMTWMRIAPHLVRPLQFVIPIYDDSTTAMSAIRAGLFVYDLAATLWRQKGAPEPMPRGRVVSARECASLVGDIDRHRLRGAAVFYDAQMRNSERVVLSVVKSAAGAGATALNYLEAQGFVREGDRIAGVRARDILTGSELPIRAKVVVNTAGPWASHVLDGAGHRGGGARWGLSKAFNLVLTRPTPDCAIGLHGLESRLFFMTPWHGRSLIGTAHRPYEDADPDKFRIGERDIEEFLAEVNRCRPSIGIRRDEVAFWHQGLVPATLAPSRPALLRRSQILANGAHGGGDGVITVISTKFTTARSVAERVVDQVFRRFGMRPPPSRSAEIPVHGGDAGGVENLVSRAVATRPPGVDRALVRRWVLNYGSAYPEVLRHAQIDPAGTLEAGGRLAGLRAEVLYGIREEMAQTLSDVVFRRTELGALGLPGDRSLEECAGVMAEELGWAAATTASELGEVRNAYRLGNGRE